METHPLPQNITSFEDRIIGDITVKQFAFLLVGAITAFLLLITPLPKFLKFFLGASVAIFSFGMAFLKIEGRSLDIWALNFIFAIYSPTQMIWVKKEFAPSFLVEEVILQKEKEKTPEKEKTREEFEEMLNFFSPISMEEKLDPEEKTFLSSLEFEVPVKTRLIAATQPEVVPPPPSPPPPKPTPFVFPPPPLPEKEKEVRKLPSPPLPPVKKIEKEAKLPSPPLPAKEEPTEKVEARWIPPPPALPKEEEIKEKPLPEKKWAKEKSKRVITPLASEINFLEKPVFRARTPEGQTRFVSALTNVRISRGLHRLPPTEGTLVLPILGEKKFEISEKLEKRFKPPEPELKPVVKMEAKPPKKIPQPPPKPSRPTEEREIPQTEKEKAILQTQLGDLTKELSELRQKLKELSSKNITYDQKLEEKLKELEKTRKEKENALKEIEKLKKEEISPPTPTPIPPSPPSEKRLPSKKVSPTPVPVVKKAPPKKQEKLVITNLPNAINGVIKTSDETLLENVIVVIKDENENPVRALKTNKLGQFSIATPLPNGTYTIEFEKGNYKFDIIEIEITGKPVPPIEIQVKI